MGCVHADYIMKGLIKGCEITAVCDCVPDRLAKFPQCKTFTNSRDLIRSGEVDAVLIATPHYQHTPIGIDALEQGLHVLVEKPISVHKADCERLIAAHKNKNQVFAAMFNQRTDPHYQKVKSLIDSGVIGEINRINWVITDWFRTEAYYASGGWRATWKGEGGGVLINQCPHQLDLMQWLFGMPCKVHAFCKFGSKHNIEVEDEVTAYLEYANGATGVFITSTGEAPGINRLEVLGENGRLTVEGSKLRFIKNEIPVTEFCKTSDQAFAAPPVWNIEIPVSGHGNQHQEITQNFIDAILHGTPLIAPAEEGINSVELANAMLYSTFTSSTVNLPLDSAAYERELKKRIEESKFEKQTTEEKVNDFTGSF